MVSGSLTLAFGWEPWSCPNSLKVDERPGVKLMGSTMAHMHLACEKIPPASKESPTNPKPPLQTPSNPQNGFL